MAVKKTVEWTDGYLNGHGTESLEKQIKEYFE